jgi:divalent metal cation (Fe/Co/Zn/Cd) transporter
MSIQKLTSAEYFRRLQMVYIALLIGQLMFAFGVSALLLTAKIEFLNNDIPNLNEILLGAMIFVTLLFVALNIVFYKKRLAIIKGKNNLKEMLADYKNATVIRLAILEFPSIAAIALTMITGNLYFFAFIGVIIALFIFYRPGKEKLKTELELNQTECMLLDDPNAIVAEIELRDFN